MTADFKDPELSLRLEEWQFFYNLQRPHSALGGRGTSRGPRAGDEDGYPRVVQALWLLVSTRVKDALSSLLNSQNRSLAGTF